MLGYVQRDVLEKIANGRRDTLSNLLDLRGRAKSSAGRYNTAVARAVAAHNEGRCGSDCPLPDGVTVESGAAGPRGGFGYWLSR